MTSPAPPIAQTYAQLKRLVEDTLLAGQRRVEQAKLRTYWETGAHISNHLMIHRERAEYGAQVVPRLARDLGVPRTTLYECVKFYRYFPASPIVRGRGQLVWTHYRLLCQVDDAATRADLHRQAEKLTWTADELQVRVRDYNLATTVDLAGGNDVHGGAAAAKPRLLTPKRGTPGLHLVVARGDELVIDLGFKFYRRLGRAGRFKAGDIVRLEEDRVTLADDATKTDLFTYAATIHRVVDGDTLIIGIDVAPDTFREERLRLRGLDCPELKTPEGKTAKQFVDGLLAIGSPAIIATTKPDKYDRYLADVFVDGDDGASTFLNNALLEHGHAARKDAWEFGDWGS